MSRLYDRIMTTYDLNGEFKAALEEAIVIIGDSVAEYFFEGTPKEHWDLIEDFPNVAPPFPKFFVECRSPRHVLSEIRGVRPWPYEGCTSWGLLFKAIDCKQLDATEAPANGRDAPWNAQEAVEAATKRIVSESGARWLITAVLILEFERRLVSEPLWCWGLAVSADGTIEKRKGSDTCIIWAPMRVGDSEMTPDRVQEEGNELLPLLNPGLLTICFMHCKNVALRAVDPPKQLAKKFLKRHGRRLVRYYVLEIEPMKRVLQQEGRSSELGLKRALHICRGHFKDYRKSGLFGKVPGIFWWDSFLRGDSDTGVVVKDYKVEGPPKERG